MNSLPLRNVRVADFTWAAAGPYSTLLLASLGAEVIKIASARARGGFPQRRAAEVDRYLNYGKLGLTLNLQSSDGADLARKLISVCDVVMENFRPGTMERFGLSYAELSRMKPDLVMVSSSSLGSEGPYSRYVGFAPIFGTMGGWSQVTGYSDGIPSELRLVVDYTAGQAAAYSALAAVYHARVTGKGQYIDMASRDVATAMVGEHVLDADLNGADSEMNSNPRTGNRDHSMAPHGAYRCAGEDAWITIAVATQEEWKGLCRAAGTEEWLADARFADQNLRWENQDALDALLGEWAAGHDPFDLMATLQREGVAAAPSYSARDLFEDPHLKARDFSQRIADNDGDEYTIIRTPYMLDGKRPEASRHAPFPGEDNRPILEGLLGISPDDVDRLIEAGAVS